VKPATGRVSKRAQTLEVRAGRRRRALYFDADERTRTAIKQGFERRILRLMR
jgi:hypothetical protein